MHLHYVQQNPNKDRHTYLRSLVPRQTKIETYVYIFKLISSLVALTGKSGHHPISWTDCHHFGKDGESVSAVILLTVRQNPVCEYKAPLRSQEAGICSASQFSEVR